jgi:RHS repeat-associated protein
VTQATYYPAANPAVVSLTGTTPDNDAYTFDSNTGRMTQYVFTVGNTPKTLKGVLNWNANGTLGSLTSTDGFNAGGSLTCLSNSSGVLGYGYDDWGRLNEFDCGSGNWGQQYAYDTNDNLTKTVLSGRTGTSWNPGYSSSTNQCTGCSFDSDGDTTADGSGSNYWGWNEFAKMKWWNTSSIAPTCGTNGKCLVYDAFGRIVKYSNGVDWYDVWITQLGSTTTMTGSTIDFSYWPAPGGRGTVEINSSTSGYNYLHGDWLGNARLLSSVANNTEYRDSAYTPYGEQFATYGLTQSYYQRFAGLTGDFNNGVQWETPNRELSIVGRWLSPDPAGSGWNQYSYATNPNSFVDPTGLGASEYCGRWCYSSPDARSGTPEYNPAFGLFGAWITNYSGLIYGNTFFDALAGAPGTYVYTNMFNQTSFGFSEDLWSSTLNLIDSWRDPAVKPDQRPPLGAYPWTGWTTSIQTLGGEEEVSGILADLSQAEARASELGAQVASLENALKPVPASLDDQLTQATKQLATIWFTVELTALGWPVSPTNLGILNSGESGGPNP